MFRVMILLYEMEDAFSSPEMELPRQLREVGVSADYASQSLKDLDFDENKVIEYVRKHPADGWIVIAGSQRILDAIVRQNLPVMALFGHIANPAIAGIGPTHTKSTRDCVERLIQFGHRRIVMFARSECRKSTLRPNEKVVIDTLKAHALPCGSDILPDWEESLRGFRACLSNLFEENAPTALILQEPELLMAAQQFLVDRGLRIPDDVSLFCADYSPLFDWSQPPVTHSKWDHQKVIQRVLDWAKTVSSGGADTIREVVDAEFIEGGTIGPAPTSKLGETVKGEVW